MPGGHSDLQAYEKYTVAIICAINFEMSAVRYMLDREHPRLPAKQGDTNMYILGELSGHHIVLACLPGNQGKGAAAIVATNMDRTFPSIHSRFLVGVGGGVPSDKHDIRLGDVVVSMPEGPHGGVVQYDLGKETEDGFQLRGFLCPPPTISRSAVGMMRSDHLVAENKVEEFLSQMLQKSSRLSVYARPSIELDILFEPDYPHAPGQPTCAKCDPAKAVARPPRASHLPEIHYGLIASGDRVVKSATKRDLVAQSLGDILCFEMEAAGIATEFSCITIRGISDYTDSHKNDAWHRYAAAAAAACVKELLSYLDPEKPSLGIAPPLPSGQTDKKAECREDPDTLCSMDNLGLALHDQGKEEEAEQIHRQILELREKLLGRENPFTLTSMNNLALALYDQGKDKEAEQIHRQTLELREKVSGREHPATLCSMNNLALALHGQGRDKEAEQIHRQTLELREKLLGRENPFTLTSMNNLALTLHSQGKDKEAEQMHRQTLELREKVLGREHPNTLTSMENLALALCR